MADFHIIKVEWGEESCSWLDRVVSELVQLEHAEVEQVQDGDEGETQQQTKVTTNLQEKQ